MFSTPYYDFLHNFSQSEYESAKLLGKFYTDYNVAQEMVERILATFKVDENISSIKIIDPFCGDGRLVEILLKAISKKSNFSSLSYEITIWDIDTEAIKKAKEAILTCANKLNLNISVFDEITDAFVAYYDVAENFDICVTNPPWGLLKPLKIFNSRCDNEMLNQYKASISAYDRYMRNEFYISQPTSKFGKWGTNLGRCGLEVALRLISTTGVCGFVSPASLFNDQVSVPFRKWIFDKFNISSISYFPAELKLYGNADVSSITAITQKGATDKIHIRLYDSNFEYNSYDLNNEELKYVKQNDFLIPLEGGIDTLNLQMRWDAFLSLESFCDNNNLKFTRELDETRINEKLCKKSEFIFAKGYMVNKYSFEPDDLFVDKTKVDIPQTASLPKLVWRDVSRNSQKRRIKATLLPPNCIAGNSLGVIYSITENTELLKMLLAVMNSYVFEFQARKQLVSNHVPVGVIRKIKIPSLKIDDDLIHLVNQQLCGDDVNTQIEIYIAKMYGLNLTEFIAIVETFNEDIEFINSLKQAWQTHPKTIIPNHYSAKLSDLDMMVVKCVPPGGNWKNIPESIPSQRLAQIRESYKAGKGSRSTYYGRLLPNMPAYTINTYFNRPGNGCNIHYSQDRTISQREAARLQTFPDSFEFKGTLGAVNNQIGNAVPVLLAYQIAKQIPFKGQFIDLFCGAGGLALGFIWAGWKPIIANDIDKNAIETHKTNIDGNAICGDINSDEVFKTIVQEAEKAKTQNPELPLFVLGGPPCQGFSTANTRRGADDMRNWLFQAYVKIVKAIDPVGFVFENVKGITNLDGGKFFELIKKELSECVEEIKVNKVNAAHFAIPQRRERVIILGGSSNLVKNFNLTPCTTVKNDSHIDCDNMPVVIGVEDALGDLPEIKQSEDGSYLNYKYPPQTQFQKFMRGWISAADYLQDYNV